MINNVCAAISHPEFIYVGVSGRKYFPVSFRRPLTYYRLFSRWQARQADGKRDGQWLLKLNTSNTSLTYKQILLNDTSRCVYDHI